MWSSKLRKLKNGLVLGDDMNSQEKTAIYVSESEVSYVYHDVMGINTTERIFHLDKS